MNLIYGVEEALKAIYNEDISKLSSIVNQHKEIVLIGNGGSNAIASHIAVDYTKFLQKRARAFSDPAQLTAYLNDYGTAAYARFIADLRPNLAILISSSGNSENMVEAANYCMDYKIPFVLLTGFEKQNKMRKSCGKSALLDFWVDSKSYGVVENVHQIFLHSVVDN